MLQVHRQTVSQLHQVLIGFRDLKKHVLDRERLTDIDMRSVFTANSRLAKVMVKFTARARLCVVLCEIAKPAKSLSFHLDGPHLSTGIRKYWTQKLESLKSEWYVITNKFPETAASERSM
jgi:hypothetical protein